MLNPFVRYYQTNAISKGMRAITAGQPSGLWVLPTGTGKTLAAIEFSRLLRLPTLFLVHRDELIGQTIETAKKCWPTATVGVVKAGRHEWHGKDLVMASVQSMNSRMLERIPSDSFGLMITDEAHHIAAPTWTRCVDHFDKVFMLGLTATPDRLDGKGLAKWFGKEPLYSYSLIQAIDDGYLVHIRQYAVVTETDLDGVKTVAGDFAAGDLAAQVNTDQRNQVIIDAYKQHADGRRSIAFCVNLAHCYNLALSFNEADISAACITGDMDMEDRRSTLSRFAAGKIRVLVNCEVLTEGFDDPDIECVLWCRPTKSRALYTQGVGRGLRLPRNNREKRDLLVLDIVDSCRRHKLVNACSLMGSQKDDAGGTDVLDMVRDEEKAEQARQDSIREMFRGPVAWRLESVCPWPGLPTLEGYSPTAPWHGQEASEKQTQMLTKFGLSVQRNLTKGEASYLIDKCLACDAAYPAAATKKQEYFLRYAGLWEEGMTKREAGRRIGEAKGYMT